MTFEGIVATGGQKGSTQDEAAGGGCRIKSYPNGSGVVSDIHYIDVTFDGVYLPIQLLGHYCPFPCNTPDGEQAVKFDDIEFVNVSGRGKQREVVVEYKCDENEHCGSVSMVNVTLVNRGGEEGKMVCENIDGLIVDDLSSPWRCG